MSNNLRNKFAAVLVLAITLAILLPQPVAAERTPAAFEKVYALAMQSHVDAPDPALLSSGAIREMAALLRSKNKKEPAVGARAGRDDAAGRVARYYRAAVASTAVPADELEVAAIKGLVKALDSQSQYLSPREAKDLNVSIKGSFTGVGLQVAIKNEQLVVVAPVEGSPAYHAGIQAGDAIMKIDNVPTKGMTVSTAVDRLRGEKGSRAIITIARAPFTETYDVAIVRDTITLRSVRSRMLENDIGYLKIVQFQTPTADDVEQALRDLGSKGMKKLVLDLRNNPGGVVDACVGATAKFLPQGSLVLSLKGRGQRDGKEIRTAGPFVLRDGPMIVLVDKGSASASEIMAGALRDHQRAVIVGAKTFGQGSVQTIFPLDDGAVLRLTTARYYTPANVSVDKEGILPDVEVAEKENEDAALATAQAVLRASKQDAPRTELVRLASRIANDGQEEFRRARTANTYEAYEGFLKAFPASSRRPQALQAMAALIGKKGGSYERYRAFVQAHEDGLGYVPEKYRLVLTGPEGLRIGDIAGMVRKKGAGGDVVAAKIRSGKGRYRAFSSDEIDKLRKMGVPGQVIEAMIDSTAQADREAAELRRKKSMEDLLADIQRTQQKLDEMKTAQGSGAAVPVAARRRDAAMTDPASHCAERKSALEACKQLHGLGATVCRAAAKAQFPCP